MDAHSFLILSNNSLNFTFELEGQIRWKAISILLIRCCILPLGNIQIREQYENCNVIKEFTKTLRFEVSTYLSTIPNACSFLLAFLQS